MSFPFEPEPVGYVYEQIADHLEQRIRSGELGPNTRLPAEARLAREYRVALGTTRNAVRLLASRGLVRVVRAKGVYVLPLEPRPVSGEAAVKGSPLGDRRWLRLESPR
ncbi:winged helix-turn-helix domain-containing protein [Amycolatopsis sp.]|uniref:winged helix-turn-helix domain-containing protein n=1 Tax=Amycolatopsis sp. TaxID=37632 RepID=UPI002CAC35F8|nr:winged helix-turn-helix domain-containing protein [Amycolatopsis sp.]HVV09030.1 winged helix-turn-helix domain-containing protein [Amycolatopsis sp.]